MMKAFLLLLLLALADCEDLVADSIIVDIADEGPHDTFVRLGLKLVEPSLT